MLLEHYSHSIMIDRNLCTGCVICTLACPVQAIRVRDGKADVVKSNQCIDCGECLRVCPHQAVRSMTTKRQDLTGYKALAALPSPVIYAQFGDMHTPNDVLLALKGVGFDYVFDLAVNCEMVFIAIDEYLRRNAAPRPMISNFCPPIARMILKSYPNLVPNILPIEVPRETAAKTARRRIAEDRGIAPEDVGVFHITPCAAKVVSIMRPVGVDKSNLDGAIAIRDLYVPIKNALNNIGEVEDEWILQKSSGVGISWAIGRGSVRGLPNRRTLSVTGVKDVIRILDDVDAGRVEGIDYLELSICPGGCVGGPLVVENKHVATSRIEDLIEQYGVRSRVDTRKVVRQFEQTYLLSSSRFHAQAPEPLDTDLRRALEKMSRIEELTSMLPGKQCGACGAPSCRDLAEDIVRGNATPSDCVFIRVKELEDACAGHRDGAES
ncbi:MAG: 4Fe-4S dicluster domain-containing protein [Candidatus Eisenbacteria bacterium]|jgi:iron only hydrogenase large subunit-like protein|nr:4Fe-4S dicluster domain-containing protein [Candidatus Eisenbacteria bacterium]